MVIPVSVTVMVLLLQPLWIFLLITVLIPMPVLIPDLLSLAIALTATLAAALTATLAAALTATLTAALAASSSATNVDACSCRGVPAASTRAGFSFSSVSRTDPADAELVGVGRGHAARWRLAQFVPG